MREPAVACAAANTRHTCGEAPPSGIGPAVHRMVEVGRGTGRNRGRWQCLVAVALATTR